MYYRDAHAIIVAFSLTNSESFENLDKWIKDIENNATIANYVLVIVGNKSDCDDQKEVPYQQGQKFAKQYRALYYETSAKFGTNVNEMY